MDAILFRLTAVLSQHQVCQVLMLLEGSFVMAVGHTFECVCSFSSLEMSLVCFVVDQGVHLSGLGESLVLHQDQYTAYEGIFSLTTCMRGRDGRKSIISTIQ